MSRRVPVVPPLAAALASCAAGPSFPPEVIDLYDAARPDGVIELEIDRDGRLREAEAEIAVDDVPQHLIEAARRFVPGGRVVGAEREHTAAGLGYEIQLDVDGVAMELVLDERGGLIESEKAIARDQAPAEVLRAAETALETGAFKSVEIVTRGGDVEYHVKATRENGSYKAVIAPDGRVIRVVREARAEIEIPIEPPAAQRPSTTAGRW